MGAVKTYAIELEQQQERAVSTENPSTAFRLGMLCAASIVLDARGQYTSRFDPEGCEGWKAIGDAFNAIDAAYAYLRDLCAVHANGPAVD